MNGTIKLWSVLDHNETQCLFDEIVTIEGDAREYSQMGPTTRTVPCGTPVPANATCICDCIATSSSYPGTRTICVCDTITVPAGKPLPTGVICTCDTISVGTYTLPSSGRASRRRSRGGTYTYYYYIPRRTYYYVPRRTYYYYTVPYTYYYTVRKPGNIITYSYPN